MTSFPNHSLHDIHRLSHRFVPLSLPNGADGQLLDRPLRCPTPHVSLLPFFSSSLQRMHAPPRFPSITYPVLSLAAVSRPQNANRKTVCSCPLHSHPSLPPRSFPRFLTSTQRQHSPHVHPISAKITYTPPHPNKINKSLNKRIKIRPFFTFYLATPAGRWTPHFPPKRKKVTGVDLYTGVPPSCLAGYYILSLFPLLFCLSCLFFSPPLAS